MSHETNTLSILLLQCQLALGRYVHRYDHMVGMTNEGLLICVQTAIRMMRWNKSQEIYVTHFVFIVSQRNVTWFHLFIVFISIIVLLMTSSLKVARRHF